MSTNMDNADRALCAESEQQKQAPARSLRDAKRDEAKPQLPGATPACGSNAAANANRSRDKFDPAAFMAQLRAMLKTADIATLSRADADAADFVAQLKLLADRGCDSVGAEVHMPRAEHYVSPAGVRMLRMRQLVDRTKLSRATLYVLIATDPTFPKKIRLTARTIGFYEHEVEAWLASRAQTRAAA
ncbi:prophage CP4-57 regulatory protein (AlpA) [Burkholderia pseudomallei]|nr:prophage CP4-57 regulatory protein (AlpA) [Burkholderia pseudomallei]